MMTTESILIYAKVLLWVRGEPSPMYEMKYGPTNQVRARCLCHGSRLIIGWPSVFLGAFCVSLSFCSKKQGCSCDSRFCRLFSLWLTIYRILVEAWMFIGGNLGAQYTFKSVLTSTRLPFYCICTCMSRWSLIGWSIFHIRTLYLYIGLALQNKRVGVLRTAFRTRKVVGTFENRPQATSKWYPDRKWLSINNTAMCRTTKIAWQYNNFRATRKWKADLQLDKFINLPC